jgi:hypothetical protein
MITGQVIAVKEIEVEHDDNNMLHHNYQCVRQEINILRGLHHPYIVK